MSRYEFSRILLFWGSRVILKFTTNHTKQRTKSKEQRAKNKEERAESVDYGLNFVLC